MPVLSYLVMNEQNPAFHEADNPDVAGAPGAVDEPAEARILDGAAAPGGVGEPTDGTWTSPPPRSLLGARGAQGAAGTAGTVPEQSARDAHASQVLRWRNQSQRRNHERRSSFVKGSSHRKKRPWWVELPILIIIAFLVTFLIQTFVARVYYVPSGSMERTLHGVEHGGDRILAYKLGYDFGTPQQGDVVVFKGPPTWVPEFAGAGPTTILGRIGQALGSVIGIAPPDEKDFVKRVIAVGGQKISCCDAEGRVQVNGVSLNEPYLFMDVENHPNWAWVSGESSCAVDPSDPTRFKSFRCFGPYSVPEGTVWVMGDHRSDSADSSYNCRGLLPSDTVKCQGPIPVKDVIGRAVAIVMPPSRWGGVGSPDIMPALPADPGEGGDPPTSGKSAEPTN